MNELLISEKIKIEDLIYEVRGKQVMLYSDLAKLYQCSNGTKTINQAVKRHINRFPERFMFQLTEKEFQVLWSQLGTANFKMTRALPYAFTEEGVAMLATILRTSVAEQVSIAIMDAFVEMRRYIKSNNYDKRISNIETKIIEYDNNFKLIFDNFENKVNNDIFFEGQTYDAYSLLLDIFDNSKTSIIIIDNYIDKKLLDLLSKTDKQIKIYTKNINNELVNKYQGQYHNVKIIQTNKFHDRFIVVDNKVLYHCGASFKDLGKKCFAISRIEDENILNNLLCH